MDIVEIVTAAAASDIAIRKQREYFLLWAVLAVISAGMIVFSVTRAFVWDEGFHLIAAQLINAGKLPYIDFCFPQTPLNAYWNAALFRLFGQSWQVIHFFAALFTAGAVVLTADYVFTRFPPLRWRLACAIVAALYVALSTIIFSFCMVGQAYGTCLFLIVAAFRVAILAVERRSTALTFLTGLLAGAAADSSLLTGPVVAVLFIWMLVYGRTPSRARTASVFLAGILIAFTPVLWLAAHGVRQTFFNVIQYQTMYRRVHWDGATPHDVDALSGWLNSTQALSIGLLGIAGALFVKRKSGWADWDRAQFYLAAWLSLALTAYIATAHPTFERYFLFVTPFLAIVACAGLYWVGSSLGSPERPHTPALIISLLICLAFAKAEFDDRDAETWQDYEKVALKVEQVTPSGGMIFADELVYFLLRMDPPSGLEFSYSHKLELPPREAALYHVISEKNLAQELKDGKYDTAQNCNDDEIDRLGLAKAYAQKTDVGDCTIFWQPKGRQKK